MVQHIEEHSKLKSRGENVVIYPLAKIVNQEVIEIGDDTRIDDFTFINGGRGIKFGKGVHIASFGSIIGGGELIMEDYSGIGNGTKIVTGTVTPAGRMSPMAPENERTLIFGKTVIKREASIGTNCVIHPNVTIGEGAVVGSNSLVTKDIEPWTINVGSPTRVLRKREKINLDD